MFKPSSARSLSNTSFMSREGACGGDTHWVPNTDVFDSGSAIVVKVELSGISKEDLELTVDGNKLIVSGQRHDESRCGKRTYRVMEINYGAFRSVIELPEGYDLAQARAAYHNGFLQIDVPALNPAARAVMKESGAAS